MSGMIHYISSVVKAFTVDFDKGLFKRQNYRYRIQLLKVPDHLHFHL